MIANLLVTNVIILIITITISDINNESVKDGSWERDRNLSYNFTGFLIYLSMLAFPVLLIVKVWC